MRAFPSPFSESLLSPANQELCIRSLSGLKLLPSSVAVPTAAGPVPPARARGLASPAAATPAPVVSLRDFTQGAVDAAAAPAPPVPAAARPPPDAAGRNMFGRLKGLGERFAATLQEHQ